MSVKYKKEIATKCYELALQLRLQRKYHFHPDDIAEKFRYHYGQDVPFEQFGFEDVGKFLESIKYFFRVKPEYDWDLRLRIYLLEDYKWKYKLPVDTMIIPPIIYLEPIPPPAAPPVEEPPQEEPPAPVRIQVKREPVEQEEEAPAPAPVLRVKPEPIDDDEFHRPGEVPQPAAAEPQAAAPPPPEPGTQVQSLLSSFFVLRQAAVPVPRSEAPVTDGAAPVAAEALPTLPVSSPASPMPPSGPVISSSQSQEVERSGGFKGGTKNYSFINNVPQKIIVSVLQNPPKDLPRNDGDKPIQRDERDFGPIRFPTLADLPPVSRRPRESLQVTVNVAKELPAPTVNIRPSDTKRSTESHIDRTLHCLRLLEKEKPTPNGFYDTNDIFNMYKDLYKDKFTDVFRHAFPDKKLSYLENASGGAILVDLHCHGQWKFARNNSQCEKAFMKTPAQNSTKFEGNRPETNLEQKTLIERTLRCIQHLERGERKTADGVYNLTFISHAYQELFDFKFVDCFCYAFPGQKFSHLELVSGGKISLKLDGKGVWMFTLKGFKQTAAAGKMGANSDPRLQFGGSESKNREILVNRAIKCLLQGDQKEVNLQFILTNYANAFGSNFVADCREYLKVEGNKWVLPFEEAAEGKIVMTLRGTEWKFQLARGMATHASYQSIAGASPSESHQPAASSSSHPRISAPTSRVSPVATPSDSHQPAAPSSSHPRITAPDSQLSLAIRPLMSIPIATAVAASYLPSTGTFSNCRCPIVW